MHDILSYYIMEIFLPCMLYDVHMRECRLEITVKWECP